MSSYAKTEAMEYMTRNQAQFFCVIKGTEVSQVTLATHLAHGFYSIYVKTGGGGGLQNIQHEIR